MSGRAESLDSGARAAADRRAGDPTEVEEELRLHLELMVEQLRAEGHELAEAESIARRRFGDVDRLAAECAAERAGPLGRALRAGLALLASFGWCALFVLALAFVVELPDALFLHAIVSLVVGTCAAIAASESDWSGFALRAGRWNLGLLWVLALESFFLSSGDWVHSLWSVQFPLFGFLFGSGVLLLRVWPEDREPRTGRWPSWNGGALAFAGLLVLGLLPMLLAVLPFDTRAVARVSGSPFAALLEVARFGFGGDVPASMQPYDSLQVARGLGVPARIVTVTMASSLLAASAWTVFAGLALVGRVIRGTRQRRAFLLLAPPLVASAAFLCLRAFDRAIWRNEPWLVKAYGPTLLVATATALALFLALRRGGRLPRAERCELESTT